MSGPASSPPNDGTVPAKRPQRGRPRTIDNEQLLKVAREIFLERGIQATTQEVAEQAGVSEGVLFHRFKTKEALFRAAMQLPAEEVPQLLLNAVERLDGLELRDALQQLASVLLDIGRVAIPLMMMSWSNPSQCAVPSYDETQAKYRLFLKRLALFFEAQMASGVLRRMDAEIIARTFLGTVHHYCMTRIMAGNEQGVFIPEGMFARGLVDLLLNGALQTPEPHEPASFSPRRRS